MLSGCIAVYYHEGIEDVSDLLVIEGKITDNESIFKLSRSVGLSDRLLEEKPVDDAIVYVEKDNGEKIPGIFKGSGTYSVLTETLDTDAKYCLYVKIKEEEYRSELLSPIITSEIDSITVYKKEMGAPVNIRINSHDANDRSRYYLWSYKEIWEVTANYFAEYGYLNGSNRFFSLTTADNIYYCWGRDSSGLLLGSSDKLSENVINQKTLTEIHCKSDKLSVLYYIEIEQNQIRKEAYDYYSNLQKNVSQIGGIFAPIPSEMKGNIKSITNPDLPVIGYIDVSTTTRDSLYIPKVMGFFEPYMDACANNNPDIWEDLLIHTYSPRTYAPRVCLDCRARSGASKNRPDFWPLEHY